jgi:hypothetical protein
MKISTSLLHPAMSTYFKLAATATALHISAFLAAPEQTAQPLATVHCLLSWCAFEEHGTCYPAFMV